MQIQSLKHLLQGHRVVICFKFSNFAYANTVYLIKNPIGFKLLFALNLVTLLMQIQFAVNYNGSELSCYLL